VRTERIKSYICQYYYDRPSVIAVHTTIPLVDAVCNCVLKNSDVARCGVVGAVNLPIPLSIMYTLSLVSTWCSYYS